jgi:hypothetical protein
LNVNQNCTGRDLFAILSDRYDSTEVPAKVERAEPQSFSIGQRCFDKFPGHPPGKSISEFILFESPKKKKNKKNKEPLSLNDTEALRRKMGLGSSRMDFDRKGKPRKLISVKGKSILDLNFENEIALFKQLESYFLKCSGKNYKKIHSNTKTAVPSREGNVSKTVRSSLRV